MGRFAIFVDAGYLLAASVRVCLGRPATRAAVVCDYAGMAQDIATFCEQRCEGELLRTYWYDGALKGVHTTEHLEIAALPDMKVRLGRIVSGQQKGVDSLIVLDLTTLARERAISTAFLISGDEDLREGVLVAQQLGVRVTLLGVEAHGSHQSRFLVREADRHLHLPESMVRQHVSPAPEQLTLLSAELTSTSAMTATVEVVAAGDQITEATAGEATVVGVRFGEAWMESAQPEDVERLQELKKSYPRRIPEQVDKALLEAGSAGLAVSTLGREQKTLLRRGFWSRIPG